MKFRQWISQVFFHLARFLVTILILGLLLGLVYWRMNHLYKTSSLTIEKGQETTSPLAAKPETIDLDLGQEADVKKAAQALEEAGLIQDQASFVQQAAEKGLYAYFSGGSYAIPKDAKVAEILDILTKPRLEALKDTEVVLPQGATVAQVADILVEQGLITSKGSFIDQAQAMGLANQFVPGTHQINPPIKVADLIKSLCSQEHKDK